MCNIHQKTSSQHHTKVNGGILLRHPRDVTARVLLFSPRPHFRRVPLPHRPDVAGNRAKLALQQTNPKDSKSILNKFFTVRIKHRGII